MKKLLSFTTITLAALFVFAACEKAPQEVITADNPSIITLSINAGSLETKTVFGTNEGSGYPITWAESGEAIELVEVLTPASGEKSYKGYPSSRYTLSNENANAIFSADVDALSTEGTYDYYALYPQSAYKSANTKYLDLSAIIPDTQTPPSNASPDAAATLLYASSTGHAAQPTTSLDMSFSHITAYGKMTIKDASKAFADPSETISSVSISVPAGGIYYYWNDDSIEGVPATAKDAVTIKTDNLDTSGDFVAWFTCAPYSLAIGDKLTVSVTTNANTYSRTISMTKAMNFESGKVSKFTVDMSSASSASDLSGDYLIVSTDGTNPWYVMTSDASKNFYLGDNSSVSAKTVIDFTDASKNFSSFLYGPYVWTLSKVSGGYSLKNTYTGKYVSWASDNKNSATAVDDAATLVVSDEGDGVFSVKFGGDESRKLQYNYNNGSNPRFAFYASSGQKDLHFIPVKSYSPTLKPVINVTSDNPLTVGSTGGSQTIEYTIENPIEGKGISYSTTSTWIKNLDEDPTSSGTITFEVDPQEAGAEARSGVITLSYEGAEDVEVTVNQAAGEGETTDFTTSWTATSGAFGSAMNGTTTTVSGTIKTIVASSSAEQEWSYIRTLSSGVSYVGWTSNCIQLGKNGGVENLTLSTSNIPGTIKSVSVECASYQGKHNISIKVGDTIYLDTTPTSSWTTVGSLEGTGTSSGKIEISFTGGTRALYIKSIKVVYSD